MMAVIMNNAEAQAEEAKKSAATPAASSSGLISE
jgi:hypothetical protein